MSAAEHAPAGPSGLVAGFERARTDGTLTMLIGTLLAGFAAYAWQAAGTRTLGSVRFAPVATIWTLSFLVITVLLAPIEQYATRAMSSGREGRMHLAQATPAIITILLGATVLLAAGCFLVRGKFFHAQAGYAAVGAALVICFGLLAFVRGVLAGERDFRLYGWLTGLDGMSRLAVGATALVLGGSPLVFAWSIPLCALVSLIWVGRAPRLKEGSQSTTEGSVPIKTFMATMVGGTAASQLILAGGPLLLGLLGAGDRPITVLFVAQTAGRGALLVALPLWARALPALTGIALRREHERLSSLAERILTGSFALAAIGGAFAAVAGPPVLAALFGNGSRPDALVAGAVGAGTVLAVGNLGLNQLLVAAARTHRVTISWWLALVLTVAWVALGPGSVLDRVATGFVIGETLAMVALTIASSPARAPAAIRTAVQRRGERRSRRS